MDADTTRYGDQESPDQEAGPRPPTQLPATLARCQLLTLGCADVAGLARVRALRTPRSVATGGYTLILNVDNALAILSRFLQRQYDIKLVENAIEVPISVAEYRADPGKVFLAAQDFIQIKLVESAVGVCISIHGV